MLIGLFSLMVGVTFSIAVISVLIMWFDHYQTFRIQLVRLELDRNRWNK